MPARSRPIGVLVLGVAFALAGAGLGSSTEAAEPVGSGRPLEPAPASPSPSAAPVTPRPDIVVIYMDDFSPRAERLWDRASRTPALARFVHEGIKLNASASTPLCCPARGNLLSGRYGHRNGLTRNDMRDYDAGDTVAVALQAAGYRTGFVGKFLNSLARWARTQADMRRQAEGWDTFDVIWENQGRYHDYRMWTRDGVRRHGDGPNDHSSRVAAQRAVRHIRSTRPEQPLFLVVSLYDGHPPLTPMARFSTGRACRGLAPWRGPSFDERDVSDKPGYVRSRTRLRERAYALEARCRSIRTVDWVTQRVRRALEEQGRLEDTFLVFTADNGMLMGEHRLLSKGAPYSTPVPMYVSWPARWGRTARSIEEPVQNVDLAPTFCGLAGCALGDVDGLDLTPLLDGEVDRLDRTYLYEELLHPGPRWPERRAVPAWYGIRTTLGYPDGLWVYTEYTTGEVELYDLASDPHQLRNLAGTVAHADVQAELRTLLHEGVVEPDRVRFSTTSY